MNQNYIMENKLHESTDVFFNLNKESDVIDTTFLNAPQNT